MPAPALRTERCVLRGWTPADRAPFAELNADPEVMRHFPAPLIREQSDAFVDRIEVGFAEHGWGLWAVQVAGRFAGFTGLSVAKIAAPFTPAVEVGWRLARWAWGHGYATEAAGAALRYGFTEAGAAEIVSFTAQTNERSQAVMRRLGMTRDPGEDFDHPALPAGHPLRRHVLYRLSAADRPLP